MGEAQREKMAQIIRRANIETGARVLDVGSGPGFLCEFIDGIVAVDVDAESLKRNKGTKVLASGDRLPFADSSFEVVFCLDTVHLLLGIEELGRVVKKEGKAVVTRYCNEYNGAERLNELKELFTGWEILAEFFVGSRDKEMSAVVILRGAVSKL